MNEEFETMVLGLYANHCIMWRREIVSLRSNAQGINSRLLSLEAVIEAFDFGKSNITADAKPEVEQAQTISNARAISNAQEIAKAQEMVKRPVAADSTEPPAESPKPEPLPSKTDLVPRPANAEPLKV